MYQSWGDIFLAISQGVVALSAALAAVAFRRGTRGLTPVGFLMLSLGMTLELMIPREGGADWALYTRASAIALMLCGIIRLAVEGVEVLIRRHRVHISTVATEFSLTLMYGGTLLFVASRILHFDIRQLLALPVLFALGKGLVEHRDMLAGFLIQTHRPFLPGDWVRFGEHVGQVLETGWRTTRIRTRKRESVNVPYDMIAHSILINYSGSGRVADEIFVGFGYEDSPGTIEELVLSILADMPEVLKDPRPEIGPWEFNDWSIRYRLRYWISDYAHQEAIRAKLNRSLWYVMNRHSISFPYPLIQMRELRNGVSNGAIAGEVRIINDLRRVDLFRDLSDEDLHIILPSIRTMEFARDELLIHQGEIGDCFFILRHGVVDILRDSGNGGPPLVVSAIESTASRNFFGEIALLTGEPRNSTVRARTDVEVLRIDRDGFGHLFRARPEIATRIAKIAARRIEATVAHTEAAAGNAASTAQAHKMLQTMRRIFDF